MDSEKQIIEFNYKEKIVDERQHPNSFSSQRMFDMLPESIVDKRTLQVIEIHDLFKAINHTRTAVGAAHLFHSLVNPSESIELIHAKQDSFCEVESNANLQKAIEEYINVYKEGEDDLFRLLNVHILPVMPYGTFNRALETIRKILIAARKIPHPETVYLDSLIQSITSFGGSSLYGLISGARFRTMGGIKTRKQLKFWQPRLRFRAGRLSFGSLLPLMPGLYFGAAWFFGFMDVAVAQYLFLFTSWLSILGLFYGGLIKPIFDYETAILPIRNRIAESNRFASAIEAVAAIDELLSFITYSQKVPHQTVMPEVSNNDQHFFVARDLKNPIMATEDEGFVGNDVNLENNKITFITGPNSGGKTTFCKTITQSQILGQIGAPILASYARINMADRISYQAPAFDTLNDPEGRFGTELKTTRDIFYSVTPKSLAILDEIAEGTTSHEKLSFSVNIMEGFYAIGNNTLLVTHSHELVEKFKETGVGQYLQVEFAGEIPTHQLKAGISKDSHALRVATKIGFAPEDMKKHLLEKGYLKKNGCMDNG